MTVKLIPEKFFESAVFNICLLHTCCVINCGSGYRSCIDTEKFAMFRFPWNFDLKNKWLSAIPCKNCNVTGNTIVCYKHFEVKYFKVSSTDES